MVDRLGQIAQRGEAALAKNFLLSRIDERNLARIAELAQVPENLARPAGALGSADNSERLGRKRRGD